MYKKAPDMLCFLCCPSRWGRSDQIKPLAERLKKSGIHRPIVMTDLERFNDWAEVLKLW